MKVALLSGKGGTGKTFLTVNLAAAQENCFYIDCDVEAPNGHLFFKPTIIKEEAVCIQIPEVNLDRCNGCRTCVDFCQFHALAYYNHQLNLFKEVCHSCGGCTLFCPQQALKEASYSIGRISYGYSLNIKTVSGLLNIGEASGIPIIKKLLSLSPTTFPVSPTLNNASLKDELIFIDCPPGSGCAVMETVKAADYCILVTEPTFFGLHNFKMVHELVQLFKKPYGVIINKCLDKQNPVLDFCLTNHISVLNCIPFTSELAYFNSNGKIAVRESTVYANLFKTLLATILKEAGYETTTCS